MNWYEIEYASGQKSRRVIGQCNPEVVQRLQQANPPGFLELTSMAYHSDITKQYELMQQWDDKLTNEMLINTASIVAIRKLRNDLLGSDVTGEGMMQQETPVGMLVAYSASYARENDGANGRLLQERVRELSSKGLKQFAFLGGLKFSEQSLLPHGEFIIRAYHNEVARKTTDGDVADAIMEELAIYVKQFQQEQKEEAEAEED